MSPALTDEKPGPSSSAIRWISTGMVADWVPGCEAGGPGHEAVTESRRHALTQSPCSEAT